MFFLENKILKFEYNCQIYDVTNRLSNLSQQRSQDVPWSSMLIFNKKKMVFPHKTLHTLNLASIIAYNMHIQLNQILTGPLL